MSLTLSIRGNEDDVQTFIHNAHDQMVLLIVAYPIPIRRKIWAQTNAAGERSANFLWMESASTLPDRGDSVYTRCYCEENIYWLLKRFLTPSGGEPEWDVFAVFISNPAKTVALWNQRTASCEDTAIVWDYHVVLALRQLRGTWIYDLDTCLPVPCRWNVYVDQTFPLGAGVPSQYQSLFRVVPGEVYLNNFASDRSHMLRVSQFEEPVYGSEPPAYPAICGPEAERQGIRHNLMTDFVSMEGDKGFGTVMDFETFMAWCD